MGNVEKVMKRSPVFESHSKTGGEFFEDLQAFQMRKFSEEEYMMLNQWSESNRNDYLDALNPIIPKEYMMDIERLMTEFSTAYGGADVDTTAWREIMHKASQDALAKETESFSCGNPQQITVNHASVVPVPSMETIMGWFAGSETQQACGSCCIECCKCRNGCHQNKWDEFTRLYRGPVSAYGICVGWSWLLGPISWAGCSPTTVIGLGIDVGAWLWRAYTCENGCKSSEPCIVCPAGYSEWWAGTNCSTADRW